VGIIFGSAALITCGLMSIYQLGFWKNSVVLFGRAVSLDGDNWVARLGLGMALAQEGRFDEALVQLHCYGYQGNLTEAASRLSRSLDLNPKSAETHFLLAGLLARQGQTASPRERAVELVKRGLALRPEVAPEEWLTAAVAFESTGQTNFSGEGRLRASRILPPQNRRGLP
jgi:tetratricopeptide (TPR) repeat protein